MFINNDLTFFKEKKSGHVVTAENQNAAYTTLRTVKKRLVPGFSEHVDRLFRAGSQKCQAFAFKSFQELKEKMAKHVLIQSEQSDSEELRIYFYLNYENSELTSLGEKLTTPSEKSTFKTVFLKRENPDIKDYIFVQKRQEAEKQICSDVNEVIMYDEEQVITEGLSSNVFAIFGSEVRTAPLTHVLNGTMRSIVIKACQQLGYTVKEELFSLKQLLNEANEVFVSSTSRYIVCGTQVDQIEKKYEIGLKIREKVVQQVVEEAESII